MWRMSINASPDHSEASRDIIYIFPLSNILSLQYSFGVFLLCRMATVTTRHTDRKEICCVRSETSPVLSPHAQLSTISGVRSKGGFRRRMLMALICRNSLTLSTNRD